MRFFVAAKKRTIGKCFHVRIKTYKTCGCYTRTNHKNLSINFSTSSLLPNLLEKDLVTQVQKNQLHGDTTFDEDMQHIQLGNGES